MKKSELILDFDNTIVNSTKRIVEFYNEDFRHHPLFVPAKWQYVNRYDCKDQCPLITDDKINAYFDHPKFHDGIEFMDNAKEIISLLSLNHDIKVASLGYSANLINKWQFLKKELPCITTFYGIDLNMFSDKSSIDMSKGTLVDDHPVSLSSSNARTKICFGDKYEWNENWLGIRCWNWHEVKNYLLRGNLWKAKVI